MFWRFGGYANVSTIDTLLDKPDVTLEELLDEPDLIQELKQHNTKLIEYLRDENVLNRLLNYVVAPGPPQDDDEDGDEKEESPEAPKDVGSKEKAKGTTRDKPDTTEDDEQKEEKARLKYSYVACEVLSSETWSILESLMVNHQHLKEFWSFMRRPPSLDPLQAGYFTKVNETLLEKKTEDMLVFFKSLDGIVQAILQHVDSPMVMDLLLKIISLEKADGGQGIVDWLQSQGLIPILLSYLSPDYPSSTQTSAGDFLKAIITISANASQNEQSCIGPNSLTRQLVSESCMETLITSMLRGGNPLTVGVGIVIEVIRKNNSDYDPDVGGGSDAVPSSHDPIYLGTLLRMFAKHVPDFMDLILSSKHTVTDASGARLVERGQLKSAWGIKIEPLGFDRFKTCELMAELLHCSNMGLLNERGSEEYVRQRDAERERLKAEGTLNAQKEGDSGVQYAEDTTGFTNGVSSPLAGGSPEEIRRFEIANAGDEDGFEDVAASGVLNDEIKDDFDEKSAEKDKSSSEAFTTIQDRPRIDLSDEFMDEPLSSPKLDDKMSEEDIPSPLQPGDPTSPTTSSLTEKVRRFSLEKKDSPMASEEDQPEDTKLNESSGSKDKLEIDPVDTGALSPHAEDTPAPLFASSSGPPREDAVSPKTIEGEQSGNSIDTTLGEGGDSSTSVIMSGNEQLFEPHIETDIDGKPVVGDFLKVMFVENRVVPTILSFFFRFPWNNFLHNVVYDVVQQVFNGPMDRGYNRSLAIDLFDTGRITERIIEGQQRSDEAQANKNMRLGYMGHLTLVAEEVVKFSERHPAELLSQSVLDRVLNRQWIDYVEQTLSETRERDNAILGGVRPDMSVGPRQAVLNAVSAAQGFSLANAGLNSGGNAGAGGLDTIDLANSGSASSGPFSAGGGSGLLSGFASSSDDEDEDMEEGDEDDSRGRSGAGAGVNVGGAEETSDTTPSTTASGIPLIPPPPAPLNIHNPSRARGRLAARLAMHKQRQAEGSLDEDGSADAGDGASPDKEDAEVQLEAEDDETVFPPADGVGDASPTGKPNTITVTSKGMGFGDVGRGFASLFSSSGLGSSSKNNKVHMKGQEEDENSGSPRRGNATGTDDSEEDAEEEGEGIDDDDSLLKTDSADSKQHVSIGFNGGIHTSPLPMASGERLPPPSEFEDDDDEMGELVGPGKMEDGGNSSDEDVVAGHAGEEMNSSDEEGHPVVHGVAPLWMGGAKEEELVPMPLESPVKGKNSAVEPEKRPAEDSPDDDDDEGLVEIMMGHGRTGSGDGKIALGFNKLGSLHGRSGSGDAGAKGKGKENERKRASLG